MKKLLGIVVIGLCGITRDQTRDICDKTRNEDVWTKKTQVNCGKSYRKLVII